MHCYLNLKEPKLCLMWVRVVKTTRRVEVFDSFKENILNNNHSRNNQMSGLLMHLEMYQTLQSWWKVFSQSNWWKNTVDFKLYIWPMLIITRFDYFSCQCPITINCLGGYPADFDGTPADQCEIQCLFSGVCSCLFGAHFVLHLVTA